MRISICVCIREKEIIELLINLFEFLLHFLVPGTVFQIRFRCRSPQMNTVPTGSGSGSATLVRGSRYFLL
jgi:hypothetical protein